MNRSTLVRSGLFENLKIEGPVTVTVYGPWGQKTGPDFQTLVDTPSEPNSEIPTVFIPFVGLSDTLAAYEGNLVWRLNNNTCRGAGPGFTVNDTSEISKYSPQVRKQLLITDGRPCQKSSRSLVETPMKGADLHARSKHGRTPILQPISRHECT